MSAAPDMARALLAEVDRRSSAFRVESFCFPEQVAFIRDQSRSKTGVCSRRAGKTVGCAADLVETALTYTGIVCLYITLSRLNAKRIVWGELLAINRIYNLGAVANETELCMTFPNGSRIYLSGAKDKTEIEKFRGLALKKVYVDEAQSFRAYLKELINEVLAKALYDYDGTIVLIGTPGPVPAGYFYECTVSPDWAHHGWTMLQNPHLELKSGKTPTELIQADCKRMGVTVQDPAIQRECFGRWVVDPNSLVFKWTDANDFVELPDGKRWQYVIGVDLGWSDADAIAVLGWCEKGPQVWLVEEWVAAKSGITELAQQLTRMQEKYQPLAMVMDTAGLGTKIAEECRRRYQLPVKATKKTEKFAHIELVNDALRTRVLRAKKASRFAQDAYLVEWDMDKSTGDRMVISETFHSDICDAVLYAYREALGWLHVPAAPAPKPGTREWNARQEAELEAAAAARATQQDDDDPANWPEPDFGGWAG